MTTRDRWLLLLLLALLLQSCANQLPNDPATESVARAPLSSSERPLRESRRHWLLVGQPGWCGAHVTRFGGDPEDAGVVVLRVATFRDGAAAAHAYESVTPASLYRLFHVRLLEPPVRLDYSVPLAGDEPFAIAYDARVPFELPPNARIGGEMLATRAGRAIILIESIGALREQLAAALGASVEAAGQLPASGC